MSDKLEFRGENKLNFEHEIVKTEIKWLWNNANEAIFECVNAILSVYRISERALAYFWIAYYLPEIIVLQSKTFYFSDHVLVKRVQIIKIRSIKKYDNYQENFYWK